LADDDETKDDGEQETHSQTKPEAAKREGEGGGGTEARAEEETVVEETVQVPILEENPKWHLLSDVLKEIEDLNSANAHGRTVHPPTPRRFRRTL
jgi:hypothetical protein